jgi:hypothetical protein
MGALEDWVATGDSAPPIVPRSALEEWIANGDPAPKAPAPSAPSDTAPSDTIGRRLGLGTRGALEGLLGLGAPLYDLAAIPQNLLNAGVKAATGRDLGISTRSGSERLEQGLDTVGLPAPETIGERRANRVIEGVAGVIPTMGAGLGVKAAEVASPMARRLADMLIAKPAAQIVSGAGAGLGAEAADEAGLGPVGQFAGSLLGGGLTGALHHAGETGVRLASGLLAPFHEGGQARIIASALLRQSSDPVTLRQRLLAAAVDPERRLPDSPATTAEAARDPGLGMLEGGLRSDQHSPGFGQLSPAARLRNVDEARNAVRLGALPEPAPDALPAAGNEARGLLDTAGADRAGQVAAARADIAPDNPALRLRPMGQEVAAQVGGQARERLVAQDGERTGQVVNAYDAISPEARIPFGGLQKLARELADKYYPGGPAGGLPPGLRELVRDIEAVGGPVVEGQPPPIAVVPFNELTGTHARIVSLQNDFGGDKRAQSVLIQLKNGLDDIAGRAAAPHGPPSLPVTEADLAAQSAAEGAAQRPDVAAALDEVHGSQASVDRAQLANSGGALDGRPLNRNGTAESLASFLVRNGGIRDDGGEVLQALGGTVRTRPGLLHNRSGMRLDDARELAHKEGFIGRLGQDTQGAEGTTIDDLIVALHDELNGPRPRNPESPLARGVDRELDETHGLSLSAPRDRVLSAVRDPALEQPAGAPVPDGYAPVEGALSPEDAAQWHVAEDMRRAQGQDFGTDRTGARGVATVLQRGAYGGFQVPDQGVLGHLVSTPQNVRQALRAGGEAVRPLLRQAFLDRAQAAGGVGADGNLLGSPGFGRFWRDNLDTAAALFSPRHAEQVLELANLHAGADASPRPFSPAQADRLRGAAELEAGRRADFVGDETGTRAVGRVLNRAPDGGFRVPDERVPAALLASPNAVRQTLRANPETLPALRRGFMAQAFGAGAQRATPAADGATMLRPKPFMDFWRKHSDTAGLLFGEDDMRRLRLLASDFREGLAAQSAAKMRGSPTASNLSVAHLVAEISHGLLPPNSPLAQRLARPVQWLAQLTGDEQALRHLLTEAVADPALASRLLAKATPAAADQAAQYLQTTTLERFRRAATDGSGRLLLRSEAASSAPSSADRGERERPLPRRPLPRALPLQPDGSSGRDPEQRRRDSLARKLQP